ncbi:MAG TPA: hypothetical protein VFS97_04065 [Nitrososphaeraceae archaeon]|nr:hypothetical protein [Nitrososphaeraceae archaeon]
MKNIILGRILIAFVNTLRVYVKNYGLPCMIPCLQITTIEALGARRSQIMIITIIELGSPSVVFCRLTSDIGYTFLESVARNHGPFCTACTASKVYVQYSGKAQ